MTAVLSTRSRFAAYLALTKPRIIELLLVTTVPTMVVAQRGMPEVWLIFATLVGGTLAAAGANATNMVIDRDIDTIMQRTQKRPLVTGEITPRNALVFAIALELVAAAVLWLTVNPLSALLAVSATLFYVFVYSLWLKRTSTQNIVIGGAAGAVPVLVGWAAVTGTLSWAPVRALRHHLRLDPAPLLGPCRPLPRRLLGGQRPHAPVGGQLRVHLPPDRGLHPRAVGHQLVFWPVGEMGLLYGVAAIVLGAVFTWHAVALARSGTYEKAMRLFAWSITYITLLFGAMAVDQLLPR